MTLYCLKGKWFYLFTHFGEIKIQRQSFQTIFQGAKNTFYSEAWNFWGKNKRRGRSSPLIDWFHELVFLKQPLISISFRNLLPKSIFGCYVLWLLEVLPQQTSYLSNVFHKLFVEKCFWQMYLHLHYWFATIMRMWDSTEQDLTNDKHCHSLQCHCLCCFCL